MRKLLTIVLSLLILVSLFILPATATDEEIEGKLIYISKVDKGAIIVDATKDALYGAEQELVEQNLHAFSSSLMNSVGKFCAAYDDNYIYIYINIEDRDIDYSNPEPEKTWLRESVGIIFDFDYRRSYESKYENPAFNVCYINLSGDGHVVTYHKYEKEHVNGLYERIETKTVKQTNDGHILYELALPIPENVSRDSGTKFGFEICAPDASNGTRVGCLSWSEFGYDMYQFTDVCGTAIFGEAPVAEDNSDSSSKPDKDKNNQDKDTDTDADADENSDSTVTVGAIDTTPMLIIFGCVFGGIILLIIIGLIVFLIVKANKKKKKAAKKAEKKRLNKPPTNNKI